MTLTAELTNLWPSFPDQIGIWSVGVCGGRKTEEPGEKPLEQGREPTTNSTHMWYWVQESKLSHSGRRRVLMWNMPFYSCVLSYLAMNASEAGGDLALIQSSQLFSCKCQLVRVPNRLLRSRFPAQFFSLIPPSRPFLPVNPDHTHFTKTFLR